MWSDMRVWDCLFCHLFTTINLFSGRNRGQSRAKPSEKNQIWIFAPLVLFCSALYSYQRKDLLWWTDGRISNPKRAIRITSRKLKKWGRINFEIWVGFSINMYRAWIAIYNSLIWPLHCTMCTLFSIFFRGTEQAQT